jgi:hypothetical protein
MRKQRATNNPAVVSTPVTFMIFLNRSVHISE